MLRKVVVSFVLVGLGIIIFVISVLRTVTIRYNFRASVDTVEADATSLVDYPLPYPGRVWPGSFFWSLKAARDKVWVWVNPDELKKANILLLLSDKRLVFGEEIVKKGNPDLGVSVLVKSGMYLTESFEVAESAQKEGKNVSELMGRISLSSLKHREILETIYEQVPEEGKPVISKIIGENMEVYERSAQSLHRSGREAAENPFK